MMPEIKYRIAQYYDARHLPVTRVNDTIFIPLHPSQWRKCSGCQCDICKADSTGGYWDTIAISAKAGKDARSEYTYTVHYPALHPAEVRSAYAYMEVD